MYYQKSVLQFWIFPISTFQKSKMSLIFDEIWMGDNLVLFLALIKCTKSALKSDKSFDIYCVHR